MTNAIEVTRQIISRSAVTLCARVTGDETPFMTSEEVNTITAKVFDESTSLQVAADLSLTPSEVVLDELREWEVDDTGYNVHFSLPGSYFPNGGRTYRVEVKVTPLESNAFYLPIWRLEAAEIMGE